MPLILHFSSISLNDQIVPSQIVTHFQFIRFVYIPKRIWYQTMIKEDKLDSFWNFLVTHYGPVVLRVQYSNWGMTVLSDLNIYDNQYFYCFRLLDKIDCSFPSCLPNTHTYHTYTQASSFQFPVPDYKLAILSYKI